VAIKRMRFRPLDRKSHPTGGDREAAYECKNIDYRKKFQVSPRDGLARLSSFAGIASYGDTLVAGDTRVAFGNPVYFLFDLDTGRLEGNGILNNDD